MCLKRHLDSYVLKVCGCFQFLFEPYPISQYKVRGVGGGVVCTPSDVSEAAPRQLRAEGLRLLPVPLRALPHQPVQGEGRSLYPISQYKVRGMGGGVVCTPSDVSEAAPRQLRAEGVRLLPVPLRALPHQPVQGEGRGRGRSLYPISQYKVRGVVCTPSVSTR